MLTATLIALYIASCLIVWRSVRKAVAGRQDEAGFHYGEESSLPKMTVLTAAARSTTVSAVEVR
jgi:hypothetical protein